MERIRSKESGAALIIGMIILTIMAIAGISMMDTTLQDERKTSNANARLQAFLAAEAGVNAARDYVLSLSDWDPSGCTVGDAFNSMSGVSYDSTNGTSYTVTINACNSDSVELASVGSQTGTNSTRTISFLMMAASDPPGGDPPAAITCLGGPCTIDPGNGNDAPIDGRDHDMPEDGCSGNSCWMDPIEGGDAIPSVYLDDPDNSTLVGAPGASKTSFCGQDSSDPTSTVCGNDINTTAVWDAGDYPDDPDTGESTAPTQEQYFGDSSLLGDVLSKAESANSTLGTHDTPKVTKIDTDTSVSGNSYNAGYLVVDGAEFSRSGTGVYVGLVVVTGCGTIANSGNFVVYGAIIIDGTGCGDDYQPVTGNGTIDVKYSSTALGFVSGFIFAGDPYVDDWVESIDRASDA
ncbi:pilus assembly PilX family protein [Marinobacterium litorale]|uniref:pilus assembly PilX family protein n=1 Tax=Marinobacterium litorale TaxID=404770 RepID=UPI00040AF814|nr:PilX N-terminal domain-containing pilus assembly protein [Marinobacterium litorale]